MEKKKIKKLLRPGKLRDNRDNLRKLNEGKKKLRIECITRGRRIRKRRIEKSICMEEHLLSESVYSKNL